MLSHDAFTQTAQARKTKKLFREALEAYHHQQDAQAEQYLQKCLRLDSTFVDALWLKAEMESNQGNFEQAIHDYARLIRHTEKVKPSVYFAMGRLQFQEANYEAAAESLKTYLALTVKSPSPFRKKAQLLLQSARFACQSTLHPAPTTLLRPGSNINSPAEEYINFVAEDNSRIIFTRKYLPDSGKPDKTVFKEQIFESVRLKDGGFQAAKPMIFPWAMGKNMGGVSLTADQKSMYFAACYWPGTYGSCDLYQSKLIRNQWQRPHHLKTAINSHAWDSQVCISPDGHYLLFASKRPGGKGGSDIWMSVRDSSGKWLPAVNLGDSINTAGDEMAPFLHADNQSLYFSSNGRPGMGGFDLYLSRKDSTGKWSSPVNPGYPVNTKADELNLFVGLQGRQAWISSNRNGNMDLYHFKLFAKIRPQKTYFIKGKVEDSQTGKPLKAKVILTNYSTSRPIGFTWSSATDGHFLMVLHPEKELAFHILKKNYLFYSKHFAFEDTSSQHVISAVFHLHRIQKNSVMQLENILFDFDRSTLRPEAFSELNLLTQMLQTNPKIKILIAGYTDATGSSAHNLELSVQRAKAVYDYLIMKGIDSNRLEYKGFGAAHPQNNNASPALRAQNRRTEIVIR